MCGSPQRRRPFVFMPFVPALAMALAAGCSQLRAPDLSLTSAAAREETAAGLSVEFVLAARNDNDVALPLRRVEYELLVGADESGQPAATMQQVFRGVRSPEATLRRLGEQAITLPVAIPLGPDGKARVARPVGIHQFRLNTRLTYIAPGAFAETLFDTGVSRPEVSLSQAGMLDFGPGPGSPVRLVSTSEGAP